MKKRRFTKCSVCGVSVKMDNLAEHLRRVHNKTIDGGAIRDRAKADPCEEALEKGMKLMVSERFKRAISVLKTIPDECPDIDSAYTLIGISYIQLNCLEDAITYLEKAVKADPGCPAHWYNLGAAYISKGYVAKARECANKALALNPDEEVKEKAENLLNGIKELLDLELANKPDINPETYLKLEERFRRGVEFMENEDWDAAMEEFKYVTSIDKNSAKAYGNLGVIFLLKGEIEEAEKHLKKSLDIDPSYIPVLRNYQLLDELKEKIKRDPGCLAELKDKLEMGHF